MNYPEFTQEDINFFNGQPSIKAITIWARMYASVAVGQALREAPTQTELPQTARPDFIAGYALGAQGGTANVQHELRENIRGLVHQVTDMQTKLNSLNQLCAEQQQKLELIKNIATRLSELSNKDTVSVPLPLIHK